MNCLLFPAAGPQKLAPGGAYQYEVELKNECLMRVGWAALEGRRALGTDERSFGYGGTGMKSNCGKFEPLVDF